MPVVLRSQARSVQSTVLVSSPGASTPRLSIDSRQGNAVVTDLIYEGAPFEEVANGNQTENNIDSDKYNIKKCGDKRCKTCSYLVTSYVFNSSYSNKVYKVINHAGEDLSCKSKNIVYLLSCEDCGIQYVGETMQPLHMRMNQHRNSKIGCTNIITHFKETCKNKRFNIQIIVKLKGDGKDDQGQIDDEQLVRRLKFEDGAMKDLRTIYPYGLNEKAKQKTTIQDQNTNIGLLFPPLPRKGPTFRRDRKNRNNRTQNLTKETFFDLVKTWLTGDIKKSFYLIRITLNKLRKKTLKSINEHIMFEKETLFKFDIFYQWYYIISDIIDCKLYKPPIIKKAKKAPKFVCVVNFINKGMDNISLSKIINKPEIFEKLPNRIKIEENNRICVTYKLGNPIRNKIFNYKETVTTIAVQDPPSLTTCSCMQSEFKDPNHGHIITGDLRIVEDAKLRKLLSYGPNFREPKCINYNRCKNEIINSLDDFINSLSERYKVDIQNFNDWRNATITELEKRIYQLKTYVRTKATKPILKNDSSLACLEKLQQDFVLVPIDKAANNIAFICKSFYIKRILDEVGVTDLPSNTYKICNKDVQNVIYNNIQICDKFKLKVEEGFETLPIIYWMPKMHKNPSGARFIVASSKCSTKPLSKTISYIFKLIFEQIQNFHLKSKFYTNINCFWVVNNSFPVIEKLNKINRRKGAKCISTFDFSTLYTNIEHSSLIKELSDIVDFAFQGGNKEFISIKGKNAFWSSNKYDTTFSKEDIKFAIRHLIGECYFTVGNSVFIQTIGIPMGIDPAPFWANLYLYSFETRFMKGLRKSDNVTARKFHGCSRFIDDLICLNDGNKFGESFRNIYPNDLELKCEHSGNHATFLDLDIKISGDEFIYKLYDKRDEFPFFVVRMPDRRSNIPSYIFYGAIRSEIIRIARSTLLLDDLVPRMGVFLKRMLNQGADRQKIVHQCNSVIMNHSLSFDKFATRSELIIEKIFQEID